jgi:Outer membrane protein beta-barrel domain
MKKFGLLFCFFIMSVIGKAQLIEAGFRGGLHFNQIDALGWQANYQTSPFGGVYASIGKRRLALQIEALYTTQAVTTDTSFKGLYKQYYTNFLDSATQGRFTFTKVQVPILLNFRFNRKFWVQFGATYSNSVNIIDKNNFVKTADKIFKSEDVSLSGGLWIGLTRRISVCGRYTQSLSDINKLESYNPNITGPAPIVNTTKWKNQQIQVGIGFKLL